MTPDEPATDDLFDWHQPTEEEWAEIVGAPPDWYFPLVGRVATETGFLERITVEIAIMLAGRPLTPDEIRFWWSEPSRMGTLLELAKGENAEFDALVKKPYQDARGKRNAIVHVDVRWADMDSPDEPSGWHSYSPKGNRTVYLELRGAEEAMQADLDFIRDVENKMLALYNAMSTRGAGADE